jgi:hypothetical protein
MKWEIGRLLGKGRWAVLGTVEGSTPQAALEEWIDLQGEGGVDAVQHGGYGVRSPEKGEWQHQFLVDADGVRPADMLH